MQEILSLFHHTHHENREHKVHHCGRKHKEVNPKLNYTIKHCSCGKHVIDKNFATGHATNEFLESVELVVEFTEKCPGGGWHIESGILSSR